MPKRKLEIEEVSATYNRPKLGANYWQYQTWKDKLPYNLRIDTKDYDLYGAYLSGAQPILSNDGYYHLPSRDPKTGRILKSPNHPTFRQALEEDHKLGYEPVWRNGEVYTIKRNKKFVGGEESTSSQMPRRRYKPTVEEMNKRFLNSNVGRLYQKDKPLKSVYPEALLASGLRQLQAPISAYNAVNNARFWLSKEITRETAKKQAKRHIGWAIANIANPFFRNGGEVEFKTVPKLSVGWRPKADWGDKVRLTNKGLEGQRGDNYYFDEEGHIVNATTGRKGTIKIDETYVTPLQTYTLDTDGNKTIGRDPLRVFRNDKPLKQVYPEYDLLSLFGGFSNLANKANKSLYHVGNSLNRISTSTNTNKQNVFNFGIDSKLLPNYVDLETGRTANPLYLHWQRLNNGGYNKLPKQDKFGNTELAGVRDGDPFIYPYKSKTKDLTVYNYDQYPNKTKAAMWNDLTHGMPTITNNITDDTKNKLLDWLMNKTPFSATPSTGNAYIGKSGQYKFANRFGLGQTNRSLSHEWDHALHIPIRKQSGFTLSKLNRGLRKYFRKDRNTELSARGTQIKDYFGLINPNDEITEDMLKYAADNYVKDTGFDNNMTAFFNSITNWKRAAKWLSQNATAYSIPATIGISSYNKVNE